MESLSSTLLLTDADGVARFHERAINLSEGTPASRLSRLFSAKSLQWRHSPVGFASSFHCTQTPQWLLIVQGEMGIGLQDGSWRSFGAGSLFYAGDILPQGETFNPAWHGHRSRQQGDSPLITCFIQCDDLP